MNALTLPPGAGAGATDDPHALAKGALTVGALGVVYGDIGTSPLYALKECFNPAHGVALDHSAVLGILSMTGEWSQRTALTTFTLVPARGRVIAAKLAAGVLIAVATTAVTAALSAAANLIGAALGGDGGWRIDASLVWQGLLLEIVLVLMGLGFGALLLNSPLAIVAYFALPTLWSVLGETISALHTAAGWLDTNVTTAPMSEPDMTAAEYGRLGVSVLLWVVLPLAAGSIRVLRREVT